MKPTGFPVHTAENCCSASVSSKVYSGKRLNQGQTVSWVDASSCPALPEVAGRFSVPPSTIQNGDRRNCCWQTLLQMGSTLGWMRLDEFPALSQEQINEEMA